MARFQALQVTTEDSAIRLRFRAAAGDSPFLWRLSDPDTGSLLEEGQVENEPGPDGDLLIPMLPETGPYRLQVASVANQGNRVAIEADVEDGTVTVRSAAVTSEAADRLGRLMRSVPKAFIVPIAAIWRNRKLIRSMVQRDILARYRGSFGGALWTFLTPLLLMATYAFVFGVVLQGRFSGDPSGSGYVLYFLAGMLPWLAFSEAVGRAPTVILEYRSFVNKLVFPLEILPVNLVLAGLLTEVIGLLILLSALLFLRHSVPASIIWLPLLLVPQMLLAAGLSWLLSATGVFVRDLGQLIGFFLTLWFFLTPIGYEESKFATLPAPAAHLLSMNPILILVRGYRAILLENRAPWVDGAEGLAWLWIASITLAVLGHAWFHRLRTNFADVI